MIWYFIAILFFFALAKGYPSLKKSKSDLRQILIAIFACMLFVDSYRHPVYFDARIFFTLVGLFLFILFVVFFFHFERQEFRLFSVLLMSGGTYLFRDLLKVYASEEWIVLVTVYVALMLAVYSLFCRNFHFAAWITIPVIVGIVIHAAK